MKTSTMACKSHVLDVYDGEALTGDHQI